MKIGLLTIFLLSASAQFTFSQNVRIIRASDRTTVTNPVIIPAPVRPAKTSDSAEAIKKTTLSAAANSSTKKNTNIKSVRGSSCKKPCVKKVCADKKNSKSARTQKPVESTRK